MVFGPNYCFIFFPLFYNISSDGFILYILSGTLLFNFCLIFTHCIRVDSGSPSPRIRWRCCWPSWSRCCCSVPARCCARTQCRPAWGWSGTGERKSYNFNGCFRGDELDIFLPCPLCCLLAEKASSARAWRRGRRGASPWKHGLILILKQKPLGI